MRSDTHPAHPRIPTCPHCWRLGTTPEAEVRLGFIHHNLMLVKKRLHLARAKANSALRHGGFSRAAASLCSQHVPVHRFASSATSRGLPNFLDPRGPRAHILCSPIRLSSPRFSCTSTSPFPPDTPDYSTRAHFLSTQERALSIPTRLYASYMSPFTILFTLLTLYSRLLYLVPILYPVSSNATSPKALFPSPTSFPTFLLFTQFALRHSKTPFDTILYL